MATREIDTTAVPAGRAIATGTSARVRRAGRGPDLTPYLFLAPYLLLFTLFVVAPTVVGFWMSLHRWDHTLNAGFTGHVWRGIGNYTDLLGGSSTKSSSFWHSMASTGWFTLYSVPVLITLPLLTALVLNAKFPGRAFFRAVYFAPFVLGVAVVGVLFHYIFDGNIGLVNQYFKYVGIPEHAAWTSSMPWAWIGLVGMTVWWTLGFNTVIYLAGLQDISQETYEAARVDGASLLRRFWHVTLPGLRPVITFVITITILASANMFGQAFFVTQGNPGDKTRTAIYYITDQAFIQNNDGLAAAMSFILAAFLVVASIIVFFVARRVEDR